MNNKHKDFWCKIGWHDYIVLDRYPKGLGDDFLHLAKEIKICIECGHIVDKITPLLERAEFNIRRRKKAKQMYEEIRNKEK